MAAASIGAIGAGTLDPEALGREKLRRYKMIELIGKGGFAEVFKHEDLLVSAALASKESDGSVQQSYGGRPRFVAIKRILKDTFKAGVNLGAIKELQTLGEISALGIPSPLRRHPNILQLLDAFVYGGQVHLVLEYGIVDLAAVIRDPKVVLTEAHIKGIMTQLLGAIAFLHSGGSGSVFMHRDLKPDNLLFTADGTLKIGDFGHATKAIEPEERGPKSSTEDAGMVNGGRRPFHRVFTVWYRAPELLLGSRAYGLSADMWAVGCILAELLLRQPIFPGDGSEAHQWRTIARVMGTPIDPLAKPDTGIEASCVPPSRSQTLNHSVAAVVSGARARAGIAKELASENLLFQSDSRTLGTSGGLHTPDGNWPGCSVLPGYAAWPLEPKAPRPWEEILEKVADGKSPSDPLLHLVGSLLCYDPTKRLTAAEALNHNWFSVQPSPAPPDRLPFPPAVRESIAKTAAGLA